MTDFEKFWRDHYPARLTRRGKLVKIGKPFAREQWDGLIKSGMDPQALCDAADGYAECQDPEYVKDCFRWLRDGGYEDFYGEVELHCSERDYETWTDDEKTHAADLYCRFGEQSFLNNFKYTRSHMKGLRAEGYLQPRSVTG